MKSFNAILTAATLLGLLATMAFAFEAPNEITLKRPEGNPPIATWIGPVKFPHVSHAINNGCKSCHHDGTDKSPGKYQPCSQCHGGPGTDDSTAFYRAWHSEKTMSCLGCHKQMRYAKQATPPISCVRGCHQKP